jgi:hypothetical protein
MHNDFSWLMHWFWKHCDGDWEHTYGIALYTTIEPGWHLLIRLSETELEQKSFPKNEHFASENDWSRCFVENSAFVGSSTPNNLPKLLHCFRKWAEPYFDPDQKLHKLSNDDKDLYWLVDWYQKHITTDLTSAKRIDLGTLDNPGWALDIDLHNTDLDKRTFTNVKIDKNHEDWIFCSLTNHTFSGNCGPHNCLNMIRLFREWTERSTIH